MTHDLSLYPPRPRAGLTRLVDAVKAMSPSPSALVVYGSLAKGTYRDGESDVNLAIVLERAHPEILLSLRGPVSDARRAFSLSPFVLERAEIARLVDVFPVKIADIVASHHVILGEDPFLGLTIDPEHLRLRVEQELRNHAIRLRQHAVLFGDEPRELARALFRTSSALPIELAALLRVRGRPDPSGSDRRAIMIAAATSLGLPEAPLLELAAIRAGSRVEHPQALFAQVLAVLERAIALSDEDPSS